MIRCGSGFSWRKGAYWGWIEKFEVCIRFSGIPAILSAAKTRFIAAELAASAAAAVSAWVTTPADSRA
jgi:hypothetical protein